MSDITELSKSVDKLNKTINTLAGATLFSNARMNEMVEASNKIKDNFDDIEEDSSETVKNLKNSHKLIKEENSLLLKQNEIDKKNFLLKQKEADIIEKTHKIEELRRKKSSQSNKKRIQELEREVELNKSEQKVLESNYKLSVQELEIQKQQNVESKKATEELKKRSKLMDSISSDFKKLGNNLKNFATGSLAKFFSFGVMIDGARDLYKESNKVYDSYYSLSLPLQKAEKGMMALVKKTNDYIWATKSIKDYAATYGYDMEKVEPMVNALQAKIKYIKQNAQGKYEWDVEKLADNAKHLISISKLMNMESDDMIGLLEERVRRFGDTDKQAISSMHEMAAATLSFNEIMGQGSVFTEEVGKHLLELHQNTKYWTQDFGMLNTMFNSHVALLLKQGRHQKEALHIARQFQESLQNPPELIKWKAGSKMLAEFKNEIKGLNEEQAISAVQSKWGVDEGTARTAVKAIREGHNTGFTQANILQDLLGGTKRGMQSTIGAWGSFKNFDSTVLRDMGLAQSVGDAEKIKQLIKDIEKNPALIGNNVAEAIDSLVDMEKGLSNEQKEARKKELKALMEANSSKDGEQVQSPFENAVLSTTKQAENWFSNPFVKIAAGSIGAIGSVFSNTAGYLLGNVLLKKGGAILGGAKRVITSLPKTPIRSTLSKFGSAVSSPFRKMGADRTYKKFLDSQIKSGHFSGEALESLKAERSAMSVGSKLKGAGKALSKVSALKGGLAGLAVAGLTSFVGSDRNRWDDESVALRESQREAVITRGLSSIELVKQGYASNIEEALALQSKFARNGSAAWGQVAKSGAGAIGAVATLISGPLSVGIGAVSGAVEAFTNGVNPITGALIGAGDTFYGVAEDIVGFVADLTDNKGIKDAAKGVANFRKELGYLTGSMKVQKASISSEGKARLERTANNLYFNRALASSSVLTSEELLASLNVFDLGASLTSTRELAKASGTSKEDYLRSKGLLDINQKEKEKYDVLYDAAREVAKARVQSTKSDYTEKDIEAEAQAIMNEQLEAQTKQLAEEEKANSLREQMANSEESMLKNSNEQRDYLKTLSTKASLDMAANESVYGAAAKKLGVKMKTDDSGRVYMEGVGQAFSTAFKNMST